MKSNNRYNKTLKVEFKLKKSRNLMSSMKTKTNIKFKTNFKKRIKYCIKCYRVICFNIKTCICNKQSPFTTRNLPSKTLLILFMELSMGLICSTLSKQVSNALIIYTSLLTIGFKW